MNGKILSFLLTSLDNFLCNEWDKQQTWKRGGRVRIVSYDAPDAEGIPFHVPVDPITPERSYEARCGCEFLKMVVAKLRIEYSADGTADVFETLLPGIIDEPNYNEWVLALGKTQGAVRVALHRLRRRFGELLREEILHNIKDVREADAEIRNLFATNPDPEWAVFTDYLNSSKTKNCSP